VDGRASGTSNPRQPVQPLTDTDIDALVNFVEWARRVIR